MPDTSKLFKRVYLEIGNTCNLHCSFCSPRTRPARQMTLPEFTSALMQLRPYTDSLYFHVKGEPLFHPLLEGEILLNAPALRQVNLSLHSFPERTGVDPDRYFDACFAFAKENSRRGRYTTLRLWTLGKGREADDGSLLILSRIEKAFPGTDALAERLRERSVALGKGIFVSFDQEFSWPHLTDPFISDTGFCHGLRQMIGVLADGTVVPCCLDADGAAPLGNLFEIPLSEILSGEPFSSARAAFYNRQATLPLCKHCSYRTRFDAPGKDRL